MFIISLNKLEFDDMKYIESILAEEFGHHAMIYNSDDRYCYLARPIELPYGQGSLLAVGMYGEDQIILKVKRSNGDTYETNAIEL